MSEGAGDSLVKSITNARVLEVATDVCEIALDSTLDEGLLKEVPVFGWIVKATGAVSTVRDRLFLKKVALFLANTSDLSLSERMIFEQNLDNDPTLRKKVGESLFLLLDRHEELEKPEILGRVFARYVKGQIELEEFQRAALAIDRCPATVLKKLDEHYAKLRTYWIDRAGTDVESRPFNEYLDSETTQYLYVAGIVRTEEYIETTYVENRTGVTLMRAIFGEDAQ